MTANAMLEDREQCLAAGMDDYISKPMPIDRLQQLIERAALRKAAVAEPAGHEPANQEAPLDHAVLQSIKALRREGRRDIYAMMLHSYRERTPQLIATLRAAASDGDLNALASAAHELKGSSLTIGALRIASMAASVEADARSGKPPSGASIAELDDDFDRVSAAITRELATV
jgi:HPt (histidine-containing phosphotransfer) domain-containing protein